MKNLVLIITTIAISGLSFAKNSHHVRSYVKKDGTNVNSHRQTNPNHTQRDNWSSKGNVNPYTGKEGTKQVNK